MKLDHSNIYPGNVDRSREEFKFSQEQYRQALIKWIVTSDQPFSTSEQESFVELLKTLNPDATPLSQQTIKRDIIKKFEEGVDDIKSRIGKVSSKFAFTVDGWTSKNVFPFMNIREHWLNDDWTYESKMIDFSFIEGKHDGQNLCKIFVDCLKRFEIPLSRVSAVTMDNISSNNKFMKYLQEHGIKIGTNISSSKNRVRCLPHVLNLAVQDILASLKIPLNYEEDLYAHLDHEEEGEVVEMDEDEDETDEEDDNEVGEPDDEEDREQIQSGAQPTIPKLRKLIKKIRKSTQMREKLRKICELYQIKYLVPIIDVATRWDSTFEMLERARYLKGPLGVMCSKEKTLKNLFMTDGEWIELNKLRYLLKKFHRSTKFMSMERHPTICAYLPTVNWIVESVKSFILDNPGPLADAAKMGLIKLKKYENEFKLEKCNILYIGVFLNPALKLNYFKEHGYSKAEIKDIQKSICEAFEKNYAGGTNENGENANEEISDEFLSHMYKRGKTIREPKEFQKYLSAPLSNHKVNLLDYWRSQKNEFPNLSKMAQDFLAIQGSSVPVERDFSMGTHLVTSTRCSLNPTTIRACMCLKSWLKKPKTYQSEHEDIEEEDKANQANLQ